MAISVQYAAAESWPRLLCALCVVMCVCCSGVVIVLRGNEWAVKCECCSCFGPCYFEMERGYIFYL